MRPLVIEMEDRHSDIRGVGFYINLVPVSEREHKQFCRALHQSKLRIVLVTLKHKGQYVMAEGFWAGEYDKDVEPDPRLLQRLRRWWQRPGVRDRRLILHMDRTGEWFREKGYL